LTDDSLPDWRVEKSAISSLMRGHEVIFAGMDSETYHSNVFSKRYKINWTERSRRGIPFYWYSVKNQVKRIIMEVRPDIVHAHNIFSAKMMSELHLSFIYDDHEYWSEFSKILVHAIDQKIENKSSMPRKMLRKFARYLLKHNAVRLWTKWEKEVVSSVPTITVSEKIAAGLKMIGNTNNVFVLPNFPMKSEVSNLEGPRAQSKLSSVYAGIESEEKQVNRDIMGLNDTFTQYDIGNLTIIGSGEKSPSRKLTYTGRLSRQDMFREMSKHSIGLLPWKKHWSHAFVSPNKAYEYAHAGLLVCCTSSFETVLQILTDNCVSFEDYGDLAKQLEYFRDNLDELYRKRLKIFEFARNNLIWENYEKNIFRAYQLC
jgi:glycosyltransferase involved in cell wall biosynthesis